MGGDKAGASQGFAVIRLGVWALGAGRVGEERSDWVAGEASPAGFGSWGLSMGISQARILDRVAISFSRGSSGASARTLVS